MGKYNNRFIGKLFIVFIELIIAFCGFPAYAAEVEIPSSFNPVGSGARALGMGGAFIAVADDATAASWNPGGLAHLRIPECSVVTSFFHREEDIFFGESPEGNGSHSISEKDINYLSITYPFEVYNKYNMVFSLSYQHLYDFNREWNFVLKEDTELLKYEDYWNYQQKGRLTALGLSYCIRIFRHFSAGVTLNFWQDGLTDNHWKQEYHNIKSGSLTDPFDDTLPSESFTEEYRRTDAYSFKGFNANLGILWRIGQWTIGAVFKTPFTAEVRHEATEENPLMEPENYISNDELEMPMSYGIGILYDVSDYFSISADIYRTEWSDYIYRDEHGRETWPVSGRKLNEADTGPTHQVRMGAEYRFINEEKAYLIPIRCGLFYDPAPAEGSPDDFYGFSLGLGFTENDRFSIDMAYQYRFGNNVGTSGLESWRFSQDMDEHTVYLSMILYNF